MDKERQIIDDFIDRALDDLPGGAFDGAMDGVFDGWFAVVGAIDGWLAVVGAIEGCFALVGAIDGWFAVVVLLVPIFIMNVLNCLKFSTPRPVTGSHPGAAEKPWRQQAYGALYPAAQWLSPEVMSLVKFLYDAYKMGWIQPNDDRPARRRAALTRDIIPATTGADADVPQ